jgi:ATP-dependent Clp protease ATP-binding subunit ClpA
VRAATLNLLQARGGIRKGRVRFDRNTKKTLELALREALHLGHNYIGTEHLLLGLLRNDGDPAVELLANIGVTVEPTRAWLLAALAELQAARGA